MSSDDIRKITEYIDKLLAGSTPSPLEPECFSDEYSALIRSLTKLGSDVQELISFTGKLSKGSIWTEPPGRFNFLAAPLKALQSNMKHISWQAEQVAKGNFNQSLDFMGEYTSAFNEMIRRVEKREKALKAKLDDIEDERQKLKRSQSLLSTVLHHISEIVLVLRGGEVVYINEAAMQQERQAMDSGENIVSFIRSLSDGTLNGLNIDYYDKSTRRWYYIEQKKFIWVDEMYADMFVATDVTHHKRSEIRLKRDLEYDELTTIGNRKHGIRLLNEALLQKNSFPLSLCFIDLDKLKRINDEFGHSAGDEYLKNFALKFRRNLDRSKLITRLGGDEFLVMMRRTDAAAAEALINDMQREFLIDRSECFPYPLEFSYGLLQVDSGAGVTSTDLINRADVLMYKNKLQKRRTATR